MTFVILKMCERNRNRVQKPLGSMEGSGLGTSKAPKPTSTQLAGRPTVIQYIDPYGASSNPTGGFPFCSTHIFFPKCAIMLTKKIIIRNEGQVNDLYQKRIQICGCLLSAKLFESNDFVAVLAVIF